MRGSGRPRAPTSRMNVWPWCGSAALAFSSMPSQAVVTNRRSKICSDKDRAARLPRRNPDGTDALAFRRIGVDAGTAPARVPDQSFGIDHGPVEAAYPAAMIEQRHGISGRHGVSGIDRDAMKDTFATIGEIGRGTVG